MLVEFRVTNHRSLRDEQVFTMEAGRGGGTDDVRPRRVRGVSDPLLPVAVLYGANASGKSNVLNALCFMRDAVLDSHRFWSPTEAVPRDPFAWGETRKEPSVFDATFLIDGTKYQYGFSANDEMFVEEWLYAWPNGKRQVWYERDENGFDFGGELKVDSKTIKEVTRKNALFLSVAVQHKGEQLEPVFVWFNRLLLPALHRTYPFTRRSYMSEAWVYSLLDDVVRRPEFGDRDDLIARFRNLLRASDFGIEDVIVQKDEDDEPGTGSVRSRRRVMLKHEGDPNAWLPLEQESNGTKTIFRLGMPIVHAIKYGSPLIIDELEASLHPTLAQQIVRQFNDPQLNPNNGQLIFTTHDTNLLGNVVGEPAVRRDQVWLTEKDRDGATTLYPLTDYKPRKDENLERGYLQGRYGAIPFLGNFNVGAS